MFLLNWHHAHTLFFLEDASTATGGRGRIINNNNNNNNALCLARNSRSLPQKGGLSFCTADSNGATTSGPDNGNQSFIVVDAMRQTVTNMMGTLPPQFFSTTVSTELMTTAGEDALEAMNAFIHRLVGMSDPAQMKRVKTETTTVELAKLLYWLMVVGYSIHNIEVRYDMEKVLDAPVKLAGLSPGERI